MHLRFAIVSLVVLLVVGTLATLLGRALVAQSEEDSAARSVDRLIATPLRAIIEADAAPGATSATVLSDSARLRADALAQPLLSSHLREIRIWTADRALLYGAGGASQQAAPHAPAGVTSSRLTIDGVMLFVTRNNTGRYIIEVGEESAPIDARIAGQQQLVISIVALATAFLYALLQLAFWFVVRTLSLNHRRLARMYVAGEDLRSSLDLHDVLTRLARESTTLARGAYGLVALYDHDAGDLLLRATYDQETDAISHHQRVIEEWFLRRAIVTNTTIVSANAAHAYHQFFGQTAILQGQVNVLCMPIAIRERVCGVLAVIRPPAGRHSGFSPIEIAEVGDLAVQGAMAIEQSELFAKVRSYADEVELSYDSTLKALMAALDAKDDVTEGHCERVAKLTVHLARQMGVSDAALVDIERGALLHDVGKIGVPDAVLKKPASLNDQEWEAMRKHPLLAGVMVSKVGFLEGATPILLYHHEKYDGTGYPFGLAADNIPLEARIFSIVDAYDAMTSHRPYRDAMPHRVAIEEVVANSGTQFDPNVVRAFDSLMLSRPDLHARPTARRNAPAHDAPIADSAA